MKTRARRATVIDRFWPLLLVFNPVNPANPAIVFSCCYVFGLTVRVPV